MSQSQDEKIIRLTVSENESIKATMQAIDNGALGIALITDAEGRFSGMVTDGDIRRAILLGQQTESPVADIVNRKPLVLRDELTDEKLQVLKNTSPFKDKLAVGYSLKVPVLDSDSRVIDIIIIDSAGAKTSLLDENRRRDWGAVKKVLVIGCAGYLGSVLSHMLVSRGFLVNGLDKLMYGNDGLKGLADNDNFTFFEGDIRDVRVLMDAVKGCDAVVHLAAIVGDPACKLNAEETITINYLATKLAIEVCKYSQINRYIFASTCSTYGASQTPGVQLTEDSPLEPVSLYAEMKIRSEEGIMGAMDGNFPPTILRMATLYGPSPRMRFDLVVNLFTAQSLTEGKLTVFGGTQWRPLLHIDDAAQAFISCLEAPLEDVRGQVFNVGSSQENYQIKTLAEIAAAIFPGVEVIYREDAVDERNYSVSFDKISEVLGYRTKKSVKEGMLEIKQLFDTGVISDYQQKIYSNYESML